MSDSSPAVSQTPPPAATSEDASHLQILAIFYYVFAGLNAVSVVLLGLYGVMMGAVLGSGPAGNSHADTALLSMFAGLMVFVVVLSAVFALLHFMTAQRLRQRRGHKFCQVIAVLTCLSIPFGTVLGVFTLIVLNRPSVQALFGRHR